MDELDTLDRLRRGAHISLGRHPNIRMPPHALADGARPKPFPPHLSGAAFTDQLVQFAARTWKSPTPPTRLTKVKAIQAQVAPDQAAGLEDLILLFDIEALTHVIYIILAITKTGPAKVYIGKTKNWIISRWQTHIKEAAAFCKEEPFYPMPAQVRYSHPYILYKDMQKLGWNNFIIFPLEQLPAQRWQAHSQLREQHWCNVFAQHGYMLCNNRAPHAATNLAGQPRLYHSHDWHHRAAIVCHHFHSDTHAAHIATLSLQSLISIRGHIATHSCVQLGFPFLEGDAAAIVTILDQAIKDRIPGPAQQGGVLEQQSLFIPRMINMFMDKVHLQYIVDACAPYLPPQFTCPIKVLFRYTKTLGSHLFNYKDIALMLEPNDVEQILANPCACAHLPTQFQHPHFQGCVFTRDWKVLNHPALEHLCSLGTKHRPLSTQHPLHTHIATPLVMAVIHATLDKFVLHWERQLGENSLAPWREAIARTLAEALHALPRTFSFAQLVNAQSETQVVPWRPHLRHNIAQAQINLYITYQDKASNNFVFICKKLAIQKIMADLAANAVYQPVPLVEGSWARTIVEVTTQYEQELKNLGFTGRRSFPIGGKRVDGRLTITVPYYAAIGKMHKSPAQLRFLACSVQVFTTPLAVMLTNAFGAAQSFLDDIWKDSWNTLGLPMSTAPDHCKCWLLRNSPDLVRLVQRFNDARVSIHDYQAMGGMATYDFERLYTNLPLATIHTAITYVVEKVFAKARPNNMEGEYTTLKVYFARNKRDLFRWETMSREFAVSRALFTEQRAQAIRLTHGLFADLVNLLITNTFITFGGSVYKQIMGIPMGTNPAVFIANFTLYYFELQFLERLTARTAKAFEAILIIPPYEHCRDWREQPDAITSVANIIKHYHWGYIAEKAQEYVGLAFALGKPDDYTPETHPDYPPLEPQAPGFDANVVILERFFLVHVMLSFGFMGRFLDDMFSITNPVFPQLTYTDQHFGPLSGIYSPDLRLIPSRNGLGRETGVSMLDLSIRLAPQDPVAQLFTQLFDKRRAPAFQDFPIIRFPHITSLLSSQCTYNVLKGRFHHLRRIVTERGSFVTELACIMYELTTKGYLLPMLHKKLSICMHHHPGLYNTQRHILLWLIYTHLHTLAIRADNQPVASWAARYMAHMARIDMPPQLH